MHVSDLARFEFPQGMIEGWIEAGIENLLPIQNKAIQQYRLFQGNNLIISAPTSSGKTFIGELAAVHNALQGNKSVYLVPTKALAEEKFQAFKRFYGRCGIEVVISTRDHKEYDDRLASGNFDIAIIVYEKFFQLLNTAGNLISEISMVVIDEMQLLADPERGANLELLLARLKMIQGEFQLIGLSAVIGNSRVLPEWLNADLLVDHTRPVELRLGCVSEGVYHYRCFNSGENGTEKFIPGLSGEKRITMMTVAQHLAEQDEQSLIFLPDKNSTRSMVWGLDGKISLPPADNAINELKELESSLSRDLLIEALENGLAFHNADLSAEERSIVEKYFRQGEIRILVSTTTLAMGVNLPAKNVILDLQFWQSSPGYRKYLLSLMKRSDFENIAGRAGRLGLEDEFGRAIIIASNLKDREVFRRRYLEGELEHIKPQLWEGSMSTAVMNAAALGGCKTGKAVKDFLRNSLTWKLYRDISDARDLEKDLDSGLEVCVRSGIILEDEEGKVSLSALGQAAVNMGISVETAVTINRWLEMRGNNSMMNELEPLFIASITDDGLDAYLNLNTPNFRKYKNGLHERFKSEIGHHTYIDFQHLYSQREIDEYLEIKCIRNSYLFRDYIGGLANRELEDRYELCLGSIRNAAEHISWIIFAAAEIAKKTGYNKEFVGQINVLAERLQYGVNNLGITLAHFRVPGLGRERIRTLVQQGFDSVEAIKELSVEELAKWITKPVAQRLKKVVFNHDIQASEKVSAPSTVNFQTDRLELLGTMENRRTMIKFNGNMVGLRDREFEVLLRLAVARIESEEGWMYKEDLGLPSAGITQGISRLREALTEYQSIPDQSVIENNNGHYRLTTPSENIIIDKAKLKQHLSSVVHELVA